MKLFLLFSLMMSLALPSMAADADLAYFKQFLYRKIPVGNDPDFPQYSYHFLSTYYRDLTPMPNGKYLNPVSDIFLFEDGTFQIQHRESIFDSPDATTFMPGGCMTIRGKWSVPDTKLILEGVGSAERAMVDGRYAMTLTYDRDLAQPGLKGHAVSAGDTISGSGDPLQFPCW